MTTETKQTCEICDKDITTGGYVAEWASAAYCSIECAEKELSRSDIEEGLADGEFFYTDWMDA